jgi:hypothetical protein
MGFFIVMGNFLFFRLLHQKEKSFTSPEERRSGARPIIFLWTNSQIMMVLPKLLIAVYFESTNILKF